MDLYIFSFNHLIPPLQIFRAYHVFRSMSFKCLISHSMNFPSLSRLQKLEFQVFDISFHELSRLIMPFEALASNFLSLNHAIFGLIISFKRLITPFMDFRAYHAQKLLNDVHQAVALEEPSFYGFSGLSHLETSK